MPAFILPLIVFAIAAVAVLAVVLILKKSLHQFFGLFGGRQSFAQMIDQQEFDMQNTPKSVSGMTDIYAERLARDYPGSDKEKLFTITREALLNYFQALESGDLTCLAPANEGLGSTVATLLKCQTAAPAYNGVRFHAQSIYQYTPRTASGASVVIQTSLEYRDRLGALSQHRYNTLLHYVIDKAASNSGGALNYSCPSCGAALAAANGECEYCGAGYSFETLYLWKPMSVVEF